MLISKEQLKYHVAGSVEDRPALSYIDFCAEGAVSTDGIRILIVPYPEKQEDEGLFADAKSEADARYRLSAGENILISDSDAEHISRNFFKRGEVKEPCQTFAALERKEDGTAAVSMVNGELRKEFHMTAEETDFPSWRSVVPRSEPTLTQYYDLDLLIDLLKKIQSAGNSRFVRCDFRGEKGVTTLQTVSESKDFAFRAIYAFIVPSSVGVNTGTKPEEETEGKES